MSLQTFSINETPPASKLNALSQQTVIVCTTSTRPVGVEGMHIYETNMEDLDRFLAEGWQTTELEMPPMPCGDPWPSVQELVRFEESLRMGADPLEAVIPADPYWGDIARLLVVYSLSKLGRWDDVQTVATQFVHGFYRVFVDDRLDRDTGRDQ